MLLGVRYEKWHCFHGKRSTTLAQLRVPSSLFIRYCSHLLNLSATWWHVFSCLHWLHVFCLLSLVHDLQVTIHNSVLNSLWFNLPYITMVLRFQSVLVAQQVLSHNHVHSLHYCNAPKFNSYLTVTRAFFPNLVSQMRAVTMRTLIWTLSLVYNCAICYMFTVQRSCH